MLRHHVLAVFALPLLIASCHRDDAPSRATGSDAEPPARAAVDQPTTRATSRLADRTKPPTKLAAPTKIGIETDEDEVDDDDASPGHEPGCAGPGATEAVAAEHVDVRTDGAPIRGNAHAPVTVVVFSDFECPYCKKLEASLARLRRAHSADVRIVAMQRPLPMHGHARLAAKAALAAGEQNQYWPFHDALIAHEAGLDRAVLERIAADLGLDLARFRSALDGDQLEQRLDAQEEEADRLGIKGTPTFFVNGRRLTGALPYAKLEAEVERELDSSR